MSELVIRNARVMTCDPARAGLGMIERGAIAVRNSRHPSGPALIYTRAEITAFLTGVKNGEFDDLRPGGGM